MKSDLLGQAVLLLCLGRVLFNYVFAYMVRVFILLNGQVASQRQSFGRNLGMLSSRSGKIPLENHL